MNRLMIKCKMRNEAKAMFGVRFTDSVTIGSANNPGASHWVARATVVASLLFAAIMSSSIVWAQSTDIRAQMSAVFSKGKNIQKVQLSGNANWYAGSLEDSGPVELTASTDGSSQMQLSLSASGVRTESQDPSTAGGGKCHWAGNDGKAHEIRSGSCQISTLWFLPALFLQSAQTNSKIAIVDCGSGTVGSGDTVYRHLQSQLSLNMSGLPNTIADEMTKQSKTDIGLDPNSLLPSVVSYSVHPDSGASASIAVEIHYSDYRMMDGVQIPFHIQRYVNGSLQLDIQLSAAQIN